jgi:molecular chaperone GrpE
MVKAGQDPKQKQSIQEKDQHNLAEQVQALQQQVAEKEEAYRRALADYRNLQQQTQQDRARLIQMAGEQVLSDLLPTLDHIEMALKFVKDEAIFRSLELIQGSLLEVVKKHGLERLPVVNQAFDLTTMEAIDTAPGPKNQVVDVYRQGYRLQGNVIRHAQVVVGDGTKAE